MSQTIVPPAPAGGPSQTALSGSAGPGGTPAVGTLGHRIASASATIRHYLAGSPGRLRIVSALAVLAAVLVALGGGAALRERSNALDEAKRSAAHLVLVQGVQINLVQANADVTNSFLKFGLEPEGQRLDYIDKIQAASRDLAVAADASAEDAAALGRVNADLTRYTGYIGSARANNRSGNPVGANYLSTASDLLLKDDLDGDVVTRKSMVSELADRSAADQQKIDSAYSRAGHASWWLALVAIIGLGVLVWAQFYLARHSRRILNVPLAAATVGLLVGLIVAAGAMAVAQSKANDVRDGSLKNATALSNSRVAAFTAKSTESLTLIARGSATTADESWTASMKTAKTALPSGSTAAAQALVAYEGLHKTINALDVKGDWDNAVKSAVAPGTAANPSANMQFQAYADATEKTLTSQAEEATTDLGDAGGALLPAGILVVLVGLLAAIGAWWGISLRLDEYR